MPRTVRPNNGKKSPRAVRGWMGFSDGAPHFYSLENYYNGVLRADFFRTRERARRCYKDVRRVSVRVESDKRQ